MPRTPPTQRDPPGDGRSRTSPPSRRSVYSVAPESELLYSLAADGSRKILHPVVSRGRFLRGRRILAWVLMTVFFGLPHLPMGGHPAILLDWTARRFHIFGTTLLVTDSWLLLAFGVGIIVTVFFVASTFGRMWCGYLCPQLVYQEFLFRPIEALVEGPPSRRHRLAGAPWGPGKVLRKLLKWSIYAVLALGMAATFFAYFVGWDGVVAALGGGWDAGALPLAILGLSAVVFFDFVSFRDQMCTVACPYGRLQNVLTDPDTVIVGYDGGRGEPRGKRTPEEDRARGDCIDCGRCVATCPTGMDIRRGLQMECVGCAQCIDACDDVMTRLGRPRGLIRYTSLRELETGTRRFWRPRLFVYLAIMTVAWGALVWMGASRSPASVEILRNGREAFRMLPTGEVANQLRVRITNQLPVVQVFTVSLVSPEGAVLVVSLSPIVVEPDAVETVNLVARLPVAALPRGKVTGRFVIRSDREFTLERDFVLLGPSR